MPPRVYEIEGLLYKRTPAPGINVYEYREHVSSCGASSVVGLPCLSTRDYTSLKRRDFNESCLRCGESEGPGEACFELEL